LDKLDEVCWNNLSSNPSIFQVDYGEMRKIVEPFYKELVEKVFHPKRFTYYLQKYNYNILEEEYELDE